jgi:hypothetical protein
MTMTATACENEVFVTRVDGEEETFTRQDVTDYFATNFGQCGMRSFGSVSGDWRMIDMIAHDAAEFFEMDTDEEDGE